jgi:hypothetical protein
LTDCQLYSNFKICGYDEAIILLCGGDKSTQQADIEKAKKIAGEPLIEESLEEKHGNRE